jgi:hypothetical protein
MYARAREKQCPRFVNALVVRKDAFESLIPFETLILGGKMGENERVFFELE